MRPHRLALLVVLSLLTVAANHARADFEESFQFDARELRVVNLIGEITVEGHAGSDFEVVVRAAGEDATRERIRFETEEGREASLHVRFPLDESRDYVYPRWGHGSHSSFQMRGDDEGWLSRILGRDRVEIRGRDNDGLELYVDVTVRVPAGARLEVFHGGGEIQASDVVADLHLDSHVGSIVVRDVEGELFADTGSGGIEAIRVRGDVTADTGSGSVRLEEVRGEEILADTGSGTITMIDVEGDDITADTGSGGVALDRVRSRSLLVDTGSGGVSARDIAARELEIDTGSGSVDLELVEVGDGEFIVDTGSGSIDVTVPADFSAVVEASTASGGVSVDIADIDVHHRDRDEIEFTAGGGAARFELDAGSGSIRIASR